MMWRVSVGRSPQIASLIRSLLLGIMEDLPADAVLALLAALSASIDASTAGVATSLVAATGAAAGEAAQEGEEKAMLGAEVTQALSEEQPLEASVVVPMVASFMQGFLDCSWVLQVL